MAGTNPHTILVEVSDYNGDRSVKEKLADVALTPGELVAIEGDGELEPHGTANGAAQPMFCVENPYADPGSSAAIDTDYAADVTARYVYAQRGDLVYAFIKASETLVEGASYLGSDGAGALQVLTVDASLKEGAIVAVAAEDKSVGGSRERALVRIF